MTRYAGRTCNGISRQARAHAADPRLRLDGLVGRPLMLTPDEVGGLPHQPYLGSLSCIEGGNVPQTDWSGVRLVDLVAVALPLPDARFVRVSAGPYGVPVSMEDADRVLLCDRLGGVELTVEQGGPWRLVVPGERYFTSVKWVDRIEVTLDQPDDSATRIAIARARARERPMSGQASDTTRLVVYLPGSCGPLVPDLKTAFAVVAPGVELVAGKIDQTGHLAADIIAGAAVDVFVSANLHYMEQVHAAGLIRHDRVFARNALCLFVRPDGTGDITNLPDVGRPDVLTLVAPPETDPGGAYTADLFERAGMTDLIERQKRAGNVILMGTGRPVPELLASGEVDVIVMYRSLAPRFPEFTVVPLPPPFAMSDVIRFTAGAVLRDGTQHPIARAFIDLLCSPSGQDLLVRNGFLPIEP